MLISIHSTGYCRTNLTRIFQKITILLSVSSLYVSSFSFDKYKKRIYLWIFLLTKSPNELIDTEFVSPIPISSIIWSVPMISSSIKMAPPPYDTLRITKIDCSHRGIESFAGIESFPNLTYLNCGWNPVKKLELRNHYKLNYLFCPGCELSHLDIMLCHFLTVLNCRFNRLRTLNLDYCYSLRFLSCCNNLLKTLDVTPCSDSIRVNRNDNPGLFEIIHRVQQRSI